MSSPDPFSADDIEAILRFHADAGADELLADQPIDRFAARAPSPTKKVNKALPPSSGIMPSAPKTAVIPNQSVIEEAQQLASQAKTLDELRNALADFDGCNLKGMARNLAFEGGNQLASLMIVGGAASRDDDASGIAFSGPDGILLKNMFAAIDVDVEKQAYMALCVPWAPPGGGPPTPIHLNILRPFIARQIELANPQHLVILGNVAAKHLVDPNQMILKMRGNYFDLSFGTWKKPAMVMHEPAYLREQPSAKRVTWHDLLGFKKQLTQS
ncbi:MAG: uracil-DNA glycosylase [Pseudomonadota bacterium]